jgi:hypothetical protein
MDFVHNISAPLIYGQLNCGIHTGFLRVILGTDGRIFMAVSLLECIPYNLVNVQGRFERTSRTVSSGSKCRPSVQEEVDRQ